MSCFEIFGAYTAVFMRSDSELMDGLSWSKGILKGRLCYSYQTVITNKNAVNFSNFCQGSNRTRMLFVHDDKTIYCVN